MGVPTYEIPPVQKPPDRRLDSWKEIAAYVNRDVTTVQRWEKREGMPVHRHLHEKRGSVYASTEELDGWIQSRRSRLDEAEEKPDAETPILQGIRRKAKARNSVTGSSWPPIVCLGVLAAGWLLFRHSRDGHG